MRVPEEAGEGKARVKLTFPGSKRPIAERTIEIAVEAKTPVKTDAGAK